MWGGHSRPPLLNLMFALIRAFFVIKGRDCVTTSRSQKPRARAPAPHGFTCRTDSIWVARTFPATACGGTAFAVDRSAQPAFCAGRVPLRGQPRHARSRFAHRELPPAAPQTISPPVP